MQYIQRKNLNFIALLISINRAPHSSRITGFHSPQFACALLLFPLVHLGSLGDMWLLGCRWNIYYKRYYPFQPMEPRKTTGQKFLFIVRNKEYKFFFIRSLLFAHAPIGSSFGFASGPGLGLGRLRVGHVAFWQLVRERSSSSWNCCFGH